jgi:hypothetical protein
MATDEIDVTIRIDKSDAGRMDEIVHALKAHGLDRVESHVKFMIVNGSVRADALDALRKVRGVASVRQDKSYRAQAR